jgi:putative restriction endonuclease
MRFWLGVTDPAWFEFLRRNQAVEANFWQPSPVPLANFLQPGTPFLFKLRRQPYVVGGGYFVRFTTLPVSLAWTAFGEANGARSPAALLETLSRIHSAPMTPGSPIGCNVLAEPFFFSEENWIPVPSDWAPNIVRGKTYDTAKPEGRALWEAILERLAGAGDQRRIADVVDPEHMYGDEYLARGRLGQGAFRVLVIDAWHRRCAVTGERTLPALEAAHIKPYAEEGPHRVSNGLLLRADLHRLFDDGYVTVEETRGDFRFVVSNRVKAEFENGREYYRFHGRPLSNPPEGTVNRPAKRYLEWHNAEVFTV